MIKAILCDLDGTLLDSMGVWREVDRRFFRRRGIEMPSDYTAAIATMHFDEIAVYTKERFCLEMSLEEIGNEWKSDSRSEYIENVLIKPGTAEFLEDMRRRGMRLCIVTTLLEELYRPCLIRNGIMDYFEFGVTSGGRLSKQDGSIYLAAAERLGLRPEECAVLEDVPEAIAAAKSVGMQAYCVVDPISTDKLDMVKKYADGWAQKITDIELKF